MKIVKKKNNKKNYGRGETDNHFIFYKKRNFCSVLNYASEFFGIYIASKALVIESSDSKMWQRNYVFLL